MLAHPIDGRIEMRIAMRDGVRLATDIYLPEGGAGPFPVLLERIPYDKRGTNRADRTAADPQPRSKPEIAARFVREGYAYVLQDCRGRYESEGRFTKYLGEDRDGVDTLAWIMRQSWCDGRVGTLGLSYGAHVQAAMAAHDPPGLAAMFLDSGGFSSAFHSGIRQGGAFEMKQLTWAAKHALLAPETLADPARRAALEGQDIRDWIGTGPWQAGNSPLAAAPEYEAFVLDQWRNETFGPFWTDPTLWPAGHYDRFADVPTVIMSSWYDPYARAAVENFSGLTARKRSPVRLVLGPWTHGQRSVSYSGDVDFGPAACLDGNIAPDYFALRRAFFDRHMRSAAGPDYLPDPVTFFVMGGGSGRRLDSGRIDHGGQWRGSSAWPPPESHETALYLGDGTLSQDRPPPATATFSTDPAHPVPTIGGAFASGAPLMEAGAFDQRESASVFAADCPGRALAERPDVVSFETAPLAAPIRIVGNPRIELQVSSDRSDADIAVRLLDIHPPSADYPLGYAMNLTHGILRLRFREGFARAEPLEPGRVYPIAIELFPTANLFAQGHRIRVEISGSNFPFFDVNPNTGAPAGQPGPRLVATNTLHLGGGVPARLVVPILPES